MRIIYIIRSSLLRLSCLDRITLQFICVIFLVLFLLLGQLFASEAELTNIVVKSDGKNLFIDLRIKGVFTNGIKEALVGGIPVSFTFIVILYKVNDFWFNDKVASTTTTHRIQFDAIKKNYRITRSWDKTGSLAVKSLDEALLLMSEIDGLKIISSNKIKKGEHYQLRIKSELTRKKFTFTGFPWEFETDWYTINFIY